MKTTETGAHARDQKWQLKKLKLKTHYRKYVPDIHASTSNKDRELLDIAKLCVAEGEVGERGETFIIARQGVNSIELLKIFLKIFLRF